jgi:hypothetical protein
VWLCRTFTNTQQLLTHFHDGPVLIRTLSHCFMQKPTSDSSSSLNIRHPHFLGTPLGDIIGISGPSNSSMPSLPHAHYCVVPMSGLRSVAQFTKQQLLYFQIKYWKGMIFAECAIVVNLEYRIITCNYGNFWKGNHLNLFSLRNRIAVLIALESF